MAGTEAVTTRKVAGSAADPDAGGTTRDGLLAAIDRTTLDRAFAGGAGLDEVAAGSRMLVILRHVPVASGEVVSPGSPAWEGTGTTGPLDEAPDPVAALTDREREMLSLLAIGLPNAEVAARLHLGPRTAATHPNLIYAEIGVSDRVGATRFTLEHRLG